MQGHIALLASSCPWACLHRRATRWQCLGLHGAVATLLHCHCICVLPLRKFKFSFGAIYLIFNTLCRKLDRLDSSSYCSAAALRCSSNAFGCEPLVQKVWSGLLCGQTVQESDISTWGGFRRLGSMETIMSGLIANSCSCHKAMLPTCFEHGLFLCKQLTVWFQMSYVMDPNGVPRRWGRGVYRWHANTLTGMGSRGLSAKRTSCEIQAQLRKLQPLSVKAPLCILGVVMTSA